jgi:hypothetical protein
MKHQIKRILIITALLLAIVAFFSLAVLREGNSCCHAPAVHAQEPGEEPTGNPDHSPDKAECATQPDANGGMIACECHKWRNCNSGAEPKSCSNYCYKQKCRCSNPCV